MQDLISKSCFFYFFESIYSIRKIILFKITFVDNVIIWFILTADNDVNLQ